MKIKIEVDLTPSELRALIGLPDVAGLQEDMIEYLRERVTHGVEGFDPAGFVKENVQSSKAWKRLMSIARMDEFLGEEEAEAPAPQRKRTPAKKTAPARSTSRKRPASKR